MIRRPPRSTQGVSSAASDVYKRQAVDLESHTTIQNVLAPHGIPIISEEGALPPYAERSNWPLFWLVDPLDGTQSYLDHREGFAINIALCDASGPILGVVADPLSDRIFAGTQSRTPFTVSLTNLSEHRPITPRPATRPYRLVTSWNEALSKEDLLPCLLYTSPSPRDATLSRMPSSA